MAFMRKYISHHQGDFNPTSFSNVGSLIWNDQGVLSNFGSATYATIVLGSYEKSDLVEVVISLKTGTSISANGVIGGTSFPNLQFYNSKANLGGSGAYGTYTYSTNEDVVWKIQIQNGTGTIYRKDSSGNFVLDYTFSYSTAISGTVNLGWFQSDRYLTGGTINLKDCYVKVNNELVWTPLYTSDVEGYKANNIMQRQRAYFKYKTWNQPILTSATSYGTITASSDHSTDTSEPWQIFDMGATVGKRFLFTGSSSEWLMWQLPEPIKISSCTVYNSSETSYLNRFPKSITLQVSDDGSVWKTIGSASDYIQPGDKESISFVCDSDKAYSYIRWTFANTFGASPMAVGLIKINAKKITDGTSSDYDFYKDSYKAYEIKDTQWETVTQRFDYTGELQTYTVPEGVTSVQVDCVAASGLDGTESTGGKGGRVKAKLSVTPGQELKVWVGKVPDTTNTAEYNASDVRTSNADITSEEGLNSRLVVAGAGGNGTAVNWIDGNGGDGGGLVGASATAGYGTNPTGGTQTAGGTKGVNGANYGGNNGNDGLFGLGGDGAVWGSGKAGAGGAGWYGGGSGGACLGSNITGVIDGLGGAGGSSYTDPELCSETKHTQGYQSGNGYVKITYKRRKL